MKLILARHGDTFAKGDKVVWVGSKQDLDLAPNGRLQAIAFARDLMHRALTPDLIYSAQLKRTQQFAEIISKELTSHPAIVTDSRLNEIDYGSWGGRTSEEIAAQYGQAVLDDWSVRAVWPKGCGWLPGEGEVLQGVRNFVQEATAKHCGGRILVVTSNGILRFFLRLNSGEFEERLKSGALKVATGAGAIFDCGGTIPDVLEWGYKPS